VCVTQESTSNADGGRKLLGRAKVPIRFGEQVIVSILYNHDANPVHHRPDHAIQWMLGLLAAQGIAGNEEGLRNAGPEQRAYTLGSQLLAGPDVVVMPGIVLAAICYERFVPPEDVTVSITCTFTYPLLVPTKGEVEVEAEAYELASTGATASAVPGGRSIQIDAYGPGVSGNRVRLLKIEALIYAAGTDANMLYEKVVAPQFAELSKLKDKLPGMPALHHQSSISVEDRRRYSRIVEPHEPGEELNVLPISESAWQCKIPRVLTEVIDLFRHTEAYMKEVREYYGNREDETERRKAIAEYVAKERKYNQLPAEREAKRVEYLTQLQQQLYARQHTVFDPRKFRGGSATKPGVQILLDLQMHDMKLRRAIHRFYTCGRLKDDIVFMGEATVTAQPLVTKALADFLSEINLSFNTLKLMEYK